MLGAANEGVRMDLERVLVLMLPTALQLTNKPTQSTFPTAIQFERSLSKVSACPATTREIAASVLWMCFYTTILISCYQKGRYPLWLDWQMKEMPTELGMELGFMYPWVSGLMRSTNLSSFVMLATTN